jgi:Family of unknown function (DUF5989)
MAKQDRVGDFIQQVEQAQVGLVRELWAWLRDNKKWWLSPIVVVLLFVSFFVFLSGTAIAPFICTLELEEYCETSHVQAHVQGV